MSSEAIIVSDDDDMRLMLSDTVSLYRPYERVFVGLKQYLISTNRSNVDEILIEKALLGDVIDRVSSACKGVGESNILELVSLIYDPTSTNGYHVNLDPDHIKSECTKRGLKYKKAYQTIDSKIFKRNYNIYTYTTSDFKSYSDKLDMATDLDSNWWDSSFNDVIFKYSAELADILANYSVKYHYLWR